MTSSSSPGPVTTEPGLPHRSSWLSRHVRVLLVGLGVAVAAILVLRFVFGVFGDAPAEPGSMATIGIMDVVDDDSAVLVTEGLAPGETADGDVVLSNVGEADGDFTLSAGEVSDTPADPAFSEVLTLRVLEDGAEIYSGPLADVPDLDVGTWSADDKQHFTFTVTVAETAGPEYAAARTELTFTWETAEGS